MAPKPPPPRGNHRKRNFTLTVVSDTDAAQNRTDIVVPSIPLSRDKRSRAGIKQASGPQENPQSNESDDVGNVDLADGSPVHRRAVPLPAQPRNNNASAAQRLWDEARPQLVEQLEAFSANRESLAIRHVQSRFEQQHKSMVSSCEHCKEHTRQVLAITLEATCAVDVKYLDCSKCASSSAYVWYCGSFGTPCLSQQLLMCTST